MVSWAFAGNTARPKASPAVAISHRRVIGLVWRIEHPSAFDARVLTRQGPTRRTCFARGVPSFWVRANLLTQRTESRALNCMPIRQSLCAVHLQCNMPIFYARIPVLRIEAASSVYASSYTGLARNQPE